jgi:glutamyl-tRNA reductase
MQICLLGQNHKSAPLALREQLAFDEAKQERLGEMLRSDSMHREGVVLSTCNRVELYTLCDDPQDSRRRLGAYLEEIHGVDLERWEHALYFHHGPTAVRHLFHVASGLDSMVLGEGQILSQVKDAFRWAHENHLAQDVLQRAFLDAVGCGKRVRSETKLGEGAVSVAYAAVSLAKRIFTDLSKETVLLIGAGETGQRAARHLRLFGVEDLRVCNRSRERGAAVAEELDATHVPWEQRNLQLRDAGIVVCATAATEPILHAATVRDSLQASGRRTMFCADLAVPRDVEPDVGKIPGVFLYNVDDLQGIVLEGAEARRAEAAKAERIVDEQAERFWQWFHARSAVPIVSELRSHYEQLRLRELNDARSGMDGASFAVLDKITHRLLNKFLHGPTLGLKRIAAEKQDEAGLQEYRRLFGLNGAQPPSNDDASDHDR